MRLLFMRSLLFFFCFIITWSSASSQKCRPNIPLKAIICKDIPNDSVTVSCIRDSRGLMASDSNLIITSFIATAWGEGFDDTVEVPNEGANFNVSFLGAIKRWLKPGSFIDFSCIKAKHKKNNTVSYVLQPLIIELK